MHNDTDVLDRYRLMLRQMLAMVDHAHNGDWDVLIGVQRTYVAGVDELVASEHLIQLDAVGRRYKQELINQIREAEDIVRERLSARMNELSGLMQQAQQNRDVKRAYAASVAV